MSTVERYGTEVWQAILGLDADAIAEGATYWFSCSQVAKRGGVSVPTARKYLRALCASGHVAKIGNNKTTLYALVKEI